MECGRAVCRMSARCVVGGVRGCILAIDCARRALSFLKQSSNIAALVMHTKTRSIFLCQNRQSMSGKVSGLRIQLPRPEVGLLPSLVATRPSSCTGQWGIDASFGDDVIRPSCVFPVCHVLLRSEGMAPLSCTIEIEPLYQLAAWTPAL